MNFYTLMQHQLLQDSLIITAPGLGIMNIVDKWIESVTDQQLVFVVGSRDDLLNNVKTVPESSTPVVRSKLYLQGGCIQVSSDSLVKDWLNNLVPADKVSGILVLHADKVTECSYETFLLQLYREQNKDGFLKAFSEDPVAFSGFNKLEKTLKYLQLQKVSLWPRFHVQIHDEIEKVEIDLEEYHQPMTQLMIDLQRSIIDVMDQLLLDLRRSTQLEQDILTVENAMHKQFDFQLRGLLDPTWNKVSRETKQVVKDLSFMRKLLVHLIEYDCVQFLDYLENIVQAESLYSDGKERSQWLWKDQADPLIGHARDRVYKLQPVTDSDQKQLIKVLELPPKWLLLKNLLLDASQQNIMVMVHEESTVRYLNAYLLHDQEENEEHHPFMLKQFGKFCGKTKRMRALRKHLVSDKDLPDMPQQQPVQQTRQPERKRQRRSRGGTQAKTQQKSHTKEGYADLEEAMQLSEDEFEVVREQISLDEQYELAVKKEHHDEDPEVEQGEEAIHELQDQHVCISTYEPHVYGQDEQLLKDFMPDLIVMFDAEPSFIRKIELFQCLNPDHKVKVQFLLYEDSAEEQMYLTKIRQEKLVFERLIREKSLLAHRQHHMPVVGIQIKASSRKGGGDFEYALPELHTNVPLQSKPMVIVDHREFKSQLPVALHNKGFYVKPVQINVGDYVLSPNVCIERKSLADLVGSINKGRLYGQVEQMCKHYKNKKVILLIEFDGSKAFTLEGVVVLDQGGKYVPVTQKLIHYSLNFPELRIIWSPSIQATCDIFEDLKKDEPEPNVEEAASLGKDTSYGFDENGVSTTYNNLSCDMLENMPGLVEQSWMRIANRVEDLKSLTQLTEQEIGELLDNTIAARGLYSFLHDKLY